MNTTPNPTSLVYNITGNGKGKTSSALGMAMRALGWGQKVAIIQFIKNDADTGERLFFQKFFPEVLFESTGKGFTITPGDHAQFAQAGWTHAKELLATFDGDLLILDELNIAIHCGYISEEEVMASLQERKSNLNVIITGRYATDKIIDFCDLVSEVEEIKHPFQKNIPARKGLDF